MSFSLQAVAPIRFTEASLTTRSTAIPRILPTFVCDPDPSACRDYIYPWEGNDLIHTGPGNDVTQSTYPLLENLGNDTVYSDQGGDTITGGPGDDWLIHQSAQNMVMGINTLIVGTVDTSPVIDDVTVLELEGVHLIGDDNQNRITASSFIGRVVLDGLGQDDILTGTSQSDSLLGGDGDDSLVGNDGNDWLDGDTGFDTLAGGKGTDTMLGGAQDDIISDGQDGYEDSIMGGEGIDTFLDTLANPASLIFSSSANEYREQAGAVVNFMAEMEVIEITGSGGHDFIDCSTFEGQVTLNGGAGDDTLTGGFGDDLLFSTLGNNLITGSPGNDVIWAGPGADTLQGGWGTDDLDGGSGNDVLRGGNDADTLFGGEGDDRLYGDGGIDTLDAARGNDSLYGGDGDDLLIMRDSGSKLLSGEAGSDTYEIPYYLNTCGAGNVVTSRYITILEPANPAEIDHANYFAGQEIDNIRILLNTLFRTSIANCMYDRITLSPNLDFFTISSMEGEDTFEVHPSLGITFDLNAGLPFDSDHMDFYAPPSQFSSDFFTDEESANKVVTSGYKDVNYTGIATREFFQDPWQLFMAIIRR